MTNPQRNIKVGRFEAFNIDRMGDNSEERVEEAKHSGKIVLPVSVINKIYRTEQRLMIFKLINDKMAKHVFCGVSTFDGEQQKVLIPVWMFKQLQINCGDILSVELVTASIPKGEFAKFEPQTRAFLAIRDPKAVLEHCLRSYVCLSREDIISIYYNKNVYELKICETLPTETIIINECDLSVDFQEMKEEIKLPKECDLDQIQSQNYSNDFKPFSGVGRTSDGSVISTEHNSTKENCNEIRVKQKIGIPDYDYEFGKILFKRHQKDVITTESEDNSEREQTVKPQKNERKRSQEKEQKLKDNENTNQKVNRRRPITRSQTQQLRNASKTASNSSVESIASNQKKRKKNNQNK